MSLNKFIAISKFRRKRLKKSYVQRVHVYVYIYIHRWDVCFLHGWHIYHARHWTLLKPTCGGSGDTCSVLPMC